MKRQINLKKIGALLLLALAVLFLLIRGCGWKEKSPTVTKPVEQHFIVYRAAADGRQVLLPEAYTVADNGKSPLQNALETLVVTKPKDAKYDDVIPIGTKVLGLKVDNGIAYADFSKELLKGSSGSYDEFMLVYAIVNTLTEFPQVQQVQLLIEGGKPGALGGHLDLDTPLERNTTLFEQTGQQ